jgi:hypothetical protein
LSPKLGPAVFNALGPVNPAAPRAKIKNRSKLPPRIRAGTGPKPSIFKGKWQSGPSPGPPSPRGSGGGSGLPVSFEDRWVWPSAQLGWCERTNGRVQIARAFGRGSLGPVSGSAALDLGAKPAKNLLEGVTNRMSWLPQDKLISVSHSWPERVVVHAP